MPPGEPVASVDVKDVTLLYRGFGLLTRPACWRRDLVPPPGGRRKNPWRSLGAILLSPNSHAFLLAILNTDRETHLGAIPLADLVGADKALDILVLVLFFTCPAQTAVSVRLKICLIRKTEHASKHTPSAHLPRRLDLSALEQLGNHHLLSGAPLQVRG